MVVCKCRRATKLYCFVHKVPVCGECIGHPEHTHCVVRTYSEWVIDGDYEPPSCAKCEEFLKDSDKPTTRLSCLHILHTTCLVDHIESFPPYTAPAGFICPGCPLQLWPPRNPKDVNMVLYANLKAVILKTTAANAVLGVEPASASASASVPPAAFASAPIATLSSTVSGTLSEPATSSGDLRRGDGAVGTAGERSEPSAVKGGATSKLNGTTDGGQDKTSPLHGPSSLSNTAAMGGGSGLNQSSSRKGFSPTAPGPMPPSFATSSRKTSFRVDRGPVDSTYGDDYDDDEAHRKYARRGPIYRPLLQWLLPFWSPSSLPTLPISSVPRKDVDGLAAEELIDGRGGARRRARQQRALDPRKILLYFAILSCLATIVLLYTRLALSGAGATNKDELVLP